MTQNSNFPTSLDYLNGSTHDIHYYTVDTSFEPYRREAFRHRSIPSQRQSISLSNIVGEGTVATEGLWRREQVEWSMGAGQYSLDRKGEAQETRFSSSKGVDVFGFPLQAKLLPATQQKIANAGAGLTMVRCGDYTLIASGATITAYDSGWGAHACTFDTTTNAANTASGTIAAPTVIRSITANNSYAYLATDTGIFYCSVGSSYAFQLFADVDATTGYTGGYDLVRWANDQLIGARNARLYAFLPRGANASAGFGCPPSQPVNASISPYSTVGILGNSGAWTTPAGANTAIETTTLTGIVNGTRITVSGSSSFSTGTSITSVGSGGSAGQVVFAIANGGGSHSGLQVGEKVRLVASFAHRSVIEHCTVLAQSATSVTLNSAKITSSTGFGSAAIYGSTDNGFGYNKTYTVVAANTQTGHFLLFVNEVNNAYAAYGASVTTNVVSYQPDVLYTHQNSTWVWSDATGGQTQVYIAGYAKTTSGSHSGCVYRSNLLGSSTTQVSGIANVTSASVAQPYNLDTPVQALPMSPDEYPTCIRSYLNFIFVGTNRGIRMAQTLSVYDPTATATGDLKSGPLIPNILQTVTNPVSAIVGDGRFVWFGWSNYDGSSTGLGKLDLTTFIAGDPLAPAYASDLMVTGQGLICALDWDPTNNIPLIAVQGLGVYTPSATNLGQGANATVTTYVASGSITSGVFDYGIPDLKIPVFFDYNANVPTGTSVQALVTFNPGDDNSSNQTLAAYATGGAAEVSFNNNPYVKGKQFQVVMTLTAGSSNTVSPALHRWTLKAWPAITQGTQISVVANMNKQVIVDGKEVAQDSDSEYVWLDTRRLNQDILTYTEGALSVLCTVTELDRIPHKLQDTYEGGFEGDCVIYLKTIAPYTLTEVATA